MDVSKAPKKLWEHPNPKETPMWKFKESLEKDSGETFEDFKELHKYSVSRKHEFYHFTFRYFPIIYTGTLPPRDNVYNSSAPMYAVWEHNWFPAVRLNWTENILYTADLKSGARTKLHKEDNRIAIIEIKEDGIRREITWGQLRALTKEFTAALKHHGVVPGDRVAVVAGNSLDTILVMLATVALGAIFSSCSTDMGVKGILDRLTQIRPKWVFADDVTLYKGVKTDLREKMTEVVRGIVDGKVEEFQGIISIPRFGEEGAKDVTEIPKAILLQDFLSATTGNKETRSEQTFEQFPFNHPFLIVYSSGTTGPPKCILHSIGGCILNNYKESQLHRSIRPSHSRILQFTTTAWIMFLTGPSSLLVGASVVLYDGSPMHPRLTSFLELVGQESVTHWGTSPRYLQELEHNRISASNLPGNLSLSTLEVVTSTGMVLSDALFEWFYSPRSGFSPNVHLDNISGGTDIAGGFAVGNPLDPVYTGGCQGLSLGIPVEVYDPAIEPGPNVQGRALPSGQPGELVAVSPFPNMPIAFWSSNHQDPTINLTESRTKYFNSYFAKYANVWTHGDFILIHPLTNQVFILGRADGVLNPSGVRFGSSDIYSVLEKHFADDVEDSVCVGQRRAGRDTDERVLLFLLMRRSSPSPSPSPSTARSRQARPFSRSLIQDIKRTIGNELSKRHIPAYIFQTPEIPTTINNKKVELPIKQIVSTDPKAQQIKTSSTLANPQSLEFYARFFEVEREARVQEEGLGAASATAADVSVSVKSKL